MMTFPLGEAAIDGSTCLHHECPPDLRRITSHDGQHIAYFALRNSSTQRLFLRNCSRPRRFTRARPSVHQSTRRHACDAAPRPARSGLWDRHG